MTSFRWTSKRENAVRALALGYTERETAEQAGVTDRTIRRWKQNIEFSTEVDRLALVTGIAQKAGRLRIAMQVIREKTDGETVKTDRDLLDWLKYVQSETDGIRLELAAAFEAMTDGDG